MRAVLPVAATATASLSPDTCTGTALSAVLPLPSAPSVPAPHAHTVPSPRTAYPVPNPAAMAVTVLRPDTCTGTSLSVVPPLPSWPSPPHPQAHTVPSPRSAYAVLTPPAAIAVTSLSSDTCTGTALSAVPVQVSELSD